MDVAHDEGHGGFDAAGGCRNGVVAAARMVDDAFEAEDAEVSPAGGKVGFGYLADDGKRHLSIIRFGTHIVFDSGRR